MPTFKNLNDLEKYLKRNPEVVIKQNIGKEIEYECPVCKTIEKIKILSEDRGICLKCSSEFDIKFQIS